MTTKNLKTMLIFMLTFVLMLALAACGQAASGESPSSASAAAEASATTEASAATTESAAATESAAEAAEPVTLTVLAAASLTETVTEIADNYMAANPNVTITLSFDSSGTCKTQIEEGAECDIFLSAAQKQMNALDSSKSGDDNPDGLDFVEQGTRVNILENKVALVVPEGNPKNITSFDDLKDHLEAGDILMAMGNSDVPVGQYTEKILTYFGLDEEALANAGCITYGSNVKEVTTQVTEGSVDCGVVYCTDATSAGLDIIDTATAEMCGQVIYPAAVMNTSQNKEAAQAFLDYLQTDESMAVFEAVGFSPAS